MAIEISSASVFEARVAIEALNTDFCHYLDHGSVAELVNLFTEDALYAHGERITNGRMAIDELFSARAKKPRTSRHFQSNLKLEFLSETQANGHSSCMTFTADSKPPIYPANPYLVADFIDEYRRCEDGRWRIERRQIERIFADHSNQGPVDARSKDNR